MEKNLVEIDTRLGKRSVDASRFITFPRGLIGFENEQQFVLLQIRPDAPLLVLQSVHTPQLGFLVTDPRCFLPDYMPRVSDAELSLLDIADLHDAAILVTVSIPMGEPEKATLNLTGPIIINHICCTGLQIPQNDISGPARVNLYSFEKSDQSESQNT
ncbi:MAG: flagellar assembly protein FliW [Desulfovibrionaceae bacterium]|nr:flagellar assembly protein FliW [Desulfovibrionaceae bacterium]